MKKHFAYQDEKSHKFWDIETNGNAFTVTYGKVDTAGQQQTKTFASEEECQKAAEKLITENTKKGYKTAYTIRGKKLLRKAKEINEKLKQKIAEDQANQEEFVEVIPEREIISYKELKKKYTMNFCPYDENHVLLMFKGDVHIKQTVDDDWWAKCKYLDGLTWEKGTLYGIFVAGNLIVEGDIVNETYQLYVLNNLYCDYIFNSCGHTVIAGDAIVKYGIFPELPEGYIEVGNRIVTPYIVSQGQDIINGYVSTHEGIFILGTPYRDSEEETINETTYYDGANLFNPAVWGEYDRLSPDLFFALVRQGENPFVELDYTESINGETLKSRIKKFNNFIAETEYSAKLNMANLASTNELSEIKKIFDLKMPSSLEIFYQEIGSLQNDTDAYHLEIWPAEYIIKHSNINTKKQLCNSLGIVDFTKYISGNDHPKFDDVDIDLGKLEHLNSNYKCFGSYRLSTDYLDRKYYLYFDNQQKMGWIILDTTYNGNSYFSSLWRQHLDPMLTKSQATFENLNEMLIDIIDQFEHEIRQIQNNR